MPYSITTKDGITIDNIPDDIAPDAPELKKRVADIRAASDAGQRPPQTQAQAPAAEPETTAAGVVGALTRGLAIPAAGAAGGAVLGAPFGGVGAIPGAAAGLAAGALTQALGDPIVASVNNLLGTQYTLPSDAMSDLLTRIGVAEPRTEAERIIQTAAEAAGGAGGLAKTAQIVSQTARAPVTKAVAGALAEAPAMQVVSGGTSGAAQQAAEEAGAGAIGQAAAGIAGGLAGGLAAAPRSVRESVRQDVGMIGQKATEAKADIQALAQPEKYKELSDLLRNDPFNADAARYRLVGTRVLPDKQAEKAIEQGWQDGVISNLKASDDEDRRRMMRMLNIQRLGMKNERFRAQNRPSDEVGKTLEERVSFLIDKRKKDGKELESVAQNQLRNADVNFQPAIDTFVEDLNKINARVNFDSNGKASVDLKGSDIQGDNEAGRILNATLERLTDLPAGKPDAYAVHTAKRFIDTQVDYGKRIDKPLTRTAQNILKGLRRNLNTTLGDQFPQYREVNGRLSDSIDALNGLQDVVGSKVDLESPNAAKSLGTLSRRILSNVSSRVNMIDALDKVNDVSQRQGMKANGDLINQLIFANELDRMFGAPASTSFKGQIEGAITKGVEAARRPIASSALDLLAAGLSKGVGMFRTKVDEEQALKSVEELLKRTNKE